MQDRRQLKLAPTRSIYNFEIPLSHGYVHTIQITIIPWRNYIILYVTFTGGRFSALSKIFFAPDTWNKICYTPSSSEDCGVTKNIWGTGERKAYFRPAHLEVSQIDWRMCPLWFRPFQPATTWRHFDGSRTSPSESVAIKTPTMIQRGVFGHECQDSALV